ncbi:Purple acid [Nesidiocoris tenuis]|uniref:Purple acid phosphatase n=1 Tax=Nesidiocoris tenuis TaxID=355587 RepID=A0ABN7BB35_9HEMI|nr:Purple acid [Nesidiocoris tenuis]
MNFFVLQNTKFHHKNIMELCGRLYIITLFSCISLAASRHNPRDDPVKYYQPEQVHISFGETVNDFVVTWSTRDFTPSVVEFGIGGIVNTSKGQAMKFVDGGPRKSSQFIHRVTLKGLLPNQRYVYHCGSDLGWSDEFWFTTVNNGTEWSPRLAVYGDMGNENARSLPYLQKDIISGLYDAILHVGDFAYDMRNDNGEVGDQFMRQIEPIAAYVPYMVSAGNHEESYNFSHYRARFSMPGGHENLWYSFDLGPIHFINLNTEAYYFPEYGLKLAIKQYLWLEEDLKKATSAENREKRPWIITYGHRPMYCSDDDGDDCARHSSRVRTGFPIFNWFGLEPLFYKYGVDLEIWAHEHSYERLWPVYNHEVKNGSHENPYRNPKAPVHIVTGSAGCKEDTDPFVVHPEAWSAFRSSDYGFTRLQVFNSTHLYLEQVSIDLDGDVIDSMWLIKDSHGPYE